MSHSHQPSLREVFILVGCQWLSVIVTTLLLLLVQALFPGISLSAAEPVGILIGATLYVQLRSKRPELFAPSVKIRWLAFYAASISTFLQGILVGGLSHFGWLGGLEGVTTSGVAYALPIAMSILWAFSFLGTWLGLRSGFRRLQKINPTTP